LEDNENNINNKRRPKQERILVPNDDEFNNVLGGGFFPGSLTLMGGSPGVGKSTLLLQVAADIANLATPIPGIGMGPVRAQTDENNDNNMYGPVWYVSGEETVEQIAARGQRLGVLQESTPLYVWQETYIDGLCQQIIQSLQHQHATTSRYNNKENNKDNENNSSDDNLLWSSPLPPPPSLLIIDSIQTMVCNAGGSSSSAGGITQVRECVALLLRLAKTTRIPICVVGHVTKSGDVAGPKTVEHMVDCVLYLEGSSVDSGGGSGGGIPQLRTLRANKNRFGSTDEVGVYTMTSGRLLPVSDPSSLFMSHRAEMMMQEDVEGCAVSIAMEGRRAVTMEVQALVTMGMEKFNRKTVDGIPLSRVQLLLGVLQKRCRLYFTRQDVYLNVVAGQMRMDRREVNSGTLRVVLHQIVCVCVCVCVLTWNCDYFKKWCSHAHICSITLPLCCCLQFFIIADLAVAVALVSSLTQIPVRADTAFCGEIGLLGELRTVASMDKRIKEAARMGFGRIITGPESKLFVGSHHPTSKTTTTKTTITQKTTNKKKIHQKLYASSTISHGGIEWIQCTTLLEALNHALVDPLPTRSSSKKQKQSTANSQSTTVEETMLSSPGSVDELGLGNDPTGSRIITDDEEYD
jgi:DNA repair protein RadA/Sms